MNGGGEQQIHAVNKHRFLEEAELRFQGDIQDDEQWNDR